jgi:hypothetical protein
MPTLRCFNHAIVNGGSGGAFSALLILGTRTRRLIFSRALTFTLFVATAIYEGDEPITPKMLLLEVLEPACLTVITALLVWCMRTELARP